MNKHYYKNRSGTNNNIPFLSGFKKENKETINISMKDDFFIDQEQSKQIIPLRNKSHKNTNIYEINNIKENKIENTNEYNNFTFSPTLSKNSIKMIKNRKENKLEFIERLASSKRKTEYERLKYISSQNNTISDCIISTCSSERKRIREIVIDQSEKFRNKSYINDNIKKFKINKLKEFYEKIEFVDIRKEKLDIPNHIREKLLIPAINIIEESKLEFNFENFYKISENILNKYI